MFQQSSLHTELIRFSHALHMLRQTASAGLTQSAVPLLGRLARSGPLRLRELANQTFLDPSTVSRQIDNLVKSGHVRRTVDPHDGRACLLEVTREGLSVIQSHSDRITAILDDMLGDWSEEDRTRFTVLLRRLNTDAATHLPAIRDQIRSTASSLAATTIASPSHISEETTA